MLAFNPLHKIDDESPSRTSTEKKNLKVEVVSVQTPVKAKSESLKPEKIKDQNSQNKESYTEQKETSLVLNSPDNWIEFFNEIDLSPFARNYFGYLSFKDYSNNLLILNSQDDQYKIPENVFAEFKSVCVSRLGKELSIEVELGNAGISPIQRQNEIESDKQKKAEESISSDASIQKFLKKFDGKLKDGSVKPLD
jgi:DNA polymerase-3 subunit gamma/tau